VTTYRLRASGLVGAALPSLIGLGVAAIGLDALLRAGGPLAWFWLLSGTGWALLWLRLPWAVRLDDGGLDDGGTVTFLGPLRRTTVPAKAIEAMLGRWTGGMNRWFLASVWVEVSGRTVGFPLPVGFHDPEEVREHLHRLNPDIRMVD
jgi:hypothetical protein